MEYLETNISNYAIVDFRERVLLLGNKNLNIFKD